MPQPCFSLVPAAYLLLTRLRGEHLEVLLQLRRSTGYMDGHWACGIAGHVERGESVLAAAVREAQEEAAVVVRPADLQPLTAMHRSGDVGGAAREQRVDFFLTARRWEGEPQVQEPEKNAGLRWFALDALPEPVPPHELVVLEMLRRQQQTGEPVPAFTAFGFADGQAASGQPRVSR